MQFLRKVRIVSRTECIATRQTSEQSMLIRESNIKCADLYGTQFGLSFVWKENGIAILTHPI
jgi:hypothetical protein